MKKSFVLFIFTYFLILNVSASENNQTRILNDFSFKKKEKLLYLNLTTTSFLVWYGITHWGHNPLETTPHAQSEKWFEKNTKHGGADKLGHAYVGYLSSHLYSYAYEKWGYTNSDAALYGAYSSLLFTSIMEVGDSFSDFGLSYEDVISNMLGALYGYYSYKNDFVKDLLDFRVSYRIKEGFYKEDFTTDYENIKYLIALKTSGIKTLKKSYLKYFEFYLGYYIKGYGNEVNIKSRNIYVGFGLNLSKIFNTKVFNYYQIPDTYIAR